MRGRIVHDSWPGIRWAYLIFVVIAVLRIPARTGFQLQTPVCDLTLSLATAALSFTNYAHMILFALFFLITWAQMSRSPAGFAWATLATLLMGAIVELEQGATRTGNCRARDLIPDALGALLGIGIVLLLAGIRDAIRVRGRHAPAPDRPGPPAAA